MINNLFNLSLQIFGDYNEIVEHSKKMKAKIREEWLLSKKLPRKMKKRKRKQLISDWKLFDYLE